MVEDTRVVSVLEEDTRVVSVLDVQVKSVKSAWSCLSESQSSSCFSPSSHSFCLLPAFSKALALMTWGALQVPPQRTRIHHHHHNDPTICDCATNASPASFAIYVMALWLMAKTSTDKLCHTTMVVRK